MIGQSVKLTTIRGIEIGLHYSWFIIFFLITASLTARFSAAHPQWTLAEHYGVGIATSLLFFFSILFHELAHSFVALAKQMPVRSITLFVFGDVAQIDREPDRPKTEFQIAIAGPIASALLAAAFGTIALLTEGRFEHVAALGGWLASINLLLAAFNLLPGFPLDGGRVFRAAMWHFTGNLAKATGIAARTGQAMGYALVFVGIWTGFTGSWFGGLWLAFIGWFLLNAAQESVMQVSVRSVLGGLRAEDVMARDLPVVADQMCLAELVHDHVFRTGRRCFIVAQNGHLNGIVTLHHIKSVPPERWPNTTVGEVMTPAANVRVTGPEKPLLEVLRIMEGEDINQIPVVSGNRILGMLTRDHVLRVLSARMEVDALSSSGSRAAAATPA